MLCKIGEMRFIYIFLCLSFSLFAQTPKAVIFDFGGVVGKVDRQPMLEFLSKSLNKPHKKVKKDLSGEALYVAMEKPYSYWESYAGISLPLSWRKKFEAIKKAIIREVPGMRDLVRSLKSQGIQVALLSNTRVNRGRFIEKLGGYDLFDPILLSCYLGAKKPSPEIFHLLVDHLRWKPSECLFIDDRKTNVRAAKAYGIDSIHFKSAEKLAVQLAKRGINP